MLLAVLLALEVLGLRAPRPTSASEGLDTEELSISPTLAASPAAVSPSWLLCLPLAVQEQLQAQLSNLGIGFSGVLKHKHGHTLVKPPASKAPSPRVRPAPPSALTHSAASSSTARTPEAPGDAAGSDPAERPQGRAAPSPRQDTDTPAGTGFAPYPGPSASPRVPPPAHLGMGWGSCAAPPPPCRLRATGPRPGEGL